MSDDGQYKRGPSGRTIGIDGLERPRVRDPEMVMAALLRACRATPEWRVMQTIVNVLGNDPFYIEDEEAARRLNLHVDGMP